ncbi:MAG TPA: NAD-dependent epimerase/dehydratase family protein [Burkholderiales bacterium]|jgi:UDP-glucose 4-epimerase
MASCLVLGGGGFIGSHLAEALLSAGHRVRLFERPHLMALTAPATAAKAEIVTGDFLNYGDLARALSGIEVVFHLISTTLPKPSNDNPVYDVETNLVGSLRLLELCRAHRVRKVVFSSSGGTVYGVPATVPIAEAHPTEPLCSYGIQKLAIEKYLQLEHALHGLDYCILRPSNPYGERQRTDVAQGAIAVFLERALRGEPIEIWGDGSVVRDYVYVGDVAEAFVRAVSYEGAQRVFNVGSGTGTSLKELIEKIGALLGRKPAVDYRPARRVDVPINVLDSSAAARHLGWRARTPLAQGLQRTCDWMRAAR